jgi:hypothetical protein
MRRIWLSLFVLFGVGGPAWAGTCTTGFPPVAYSCPFGNVAPISATAGQQITIDFQTFAFAPATGVSDLQLFELGAPVFDETSLTQVNNDFLLTGVFETAGSTIWQGIVTDNLGGQGLVDPFGGASTIFVNVTPAVPEPSTWAMLLIGFAGIGAISYRRRLTPTSC